MKTIRRKVNSNIVLEETKVVQVWDGLGLNSNHIYKYSFETSEQIDIESIQIIVERKVPETLQEFIEVNGMPEKSFIEWLNKNYKQ